MSDAENPLLGKIRAALHTVDDPEIHRPITELGMVDEVTLDDAGHAMVRILLTVSGCPMRNTLNTEVTKAVMGVEGVSSVEVQMGVMDDEQRAALKQLLRGGEPERQIQFAQPGNLTQVIAVASGKGGVGKSSVTVNLATALASMGKSVGILDADIYGHSVPDMLGLGDAKPTAVDDMIMPVPSMGMKVISVGMLKPERDQVIAWRGPILDRALTQLLADVYWGDLDFLILDLPPGTGDVAMSLGQKIPNSEVIVVTTPQQAASEVAERAGTMAAIMQQRVIGVVENMSHLEVTSPSDGHTFRVDLFGSGGGQKAADALSDRLGYEVPLLAQIPLEQDLREGGDNGAPIVVSDPEKPSAKALLALAEHIAGRTRGLAGKQLGVSPV
ncbi:ATP-binding protein involved in chromosome partitioning [Luteococcus japonicus]|uniref:Iron-sulfur cluster carrier protein n=2 Tax=Luteococcus japonicus TaxID=33984 RepID=A0A1R4KGH9_9ACTN|nr:MULTISPECIES: Mrp/NBP35 family ATP-binding protein [Luteococcus]MDN5564780.1 Mrp/NBP35 family ATP-binding protein [Luteococcus sp.]ROR55494.1 ATP-binding protein involved in chromosome partitioning [Luteococcus japonicus]SJN43430.1 Mrp protein homolog [Luteococcus japonicus LSP_Lj1]